MTMAPTNSPSSIRLVEVFSSIQGEGILVGRRQVFVRTYGCNLRCTYCDSPETLKESGSPKVCRVESSPGSWTFDTLQNPISAKDLTAVVASYLSQPHHSLSVTGGEPLLHASFLSGWLPQIRALGLKTFIETNGLLPAKLRILTGLLDYVSMDIKPVSATGISQKTTWKSHREFLQTAIGTGARVYCKLVVTTGTTQSEVETAVDMISGIDPKVPLILQPVTPFGYEHSTVSAGRLIELHALASTHVNDVRVIPQTHKMINLL